MEKGTGFSCELKTNVKIKKKTSPPVFSEHLFSTSISDNLQTIECNVSKKGSEGT